MPKIIDDLKKLILDVAKRQIKEYGYSKVTIRSIAKECRIGIGTIYNYFSSKDMIIAEFLVEDWRLCLTTMKEYSDSLEKIYKLLQDFQNENIMIFKDPKAEISYVNSISKWHKVLRNQLASIVKLSIKKNNNDFLAEYIAESFLVWSVEGKQYFELKTIIELLVK